MSIILKRIFVVLAIIFSWGSFFVPAASWAQTDGAVSGSAVYSPNELDDGSGTPGASISLLKNLKSFGQDTGMNAEDPRLIVARLVKVVMGFVGIIVLIMILMSGLMFMTAGGDEEKTGQAKRTFLNAVIGLFIMLSAYSIVTFVLNTIITASGTSNSTSTPPVVPDPIVNP